MKRNKLMCAVLALVLLISAQPAAMATGGAYTTVIESTCRLPVIQVTVPANNSVYINPFEFAVDIEGGETSEQIISSPATIANMSEVPVAVNVSISSQVRAGSTMTLASSPTGGTGTDKSAFVYFEIQQTNSDDLDAVEWDPTYDASKHIVVATGAPVTRQNIMTLPARASESQVAENGYASFRLTGDAVKTPTVEWNNDDGVDVVVAFTFTPLSYS